MMVGKRWAMVITVRSEKASRTVAWCGGVTTMGAVVSLWQGDGWRCVYAYLDKRVCIWVNRSCGFIHDLTVWV